MNDLVACSNCGVVFKLPKVSDYLRCPVCDHRDGETTPVPKVGRVNKWWDRV